MCFFLQDIRRINAEYPGLFGTRDSEDGEDNEAGGGGNAEQFNKRYGWIYATTRIADHERIKLDDVWSLSIRQCLNNLSYLKAKDYKDAEDQKMK